MDKGIKKEGGEERKGKGGGRERKRVEGEWRRGMMVDMSTCCVGIPESGLSRLAARNFRNVLYVN